MTAILLTGSAGEIGRSLHTALSDRYQIRCLDLTPIPGADNWVVDITDMASVQEAAQGMDAVIHLAANPNVDQAWEDVYGSGIQGTYNVFEAARQANIPKIIYASSNHVSGWREVLQEASIRPEMPIRPDSLYGVGKAFGEALGQFFVDQHHMSVICLRIGTFTDSPQPDGPDARILRTWCSPRDLAQLVEKSLKAEALGFQIFYGVSGNTRRFWDISNAEHLVNYQPQDNAEFLLEAV